MALEGLNPNLKNELRKRLGMDPSRMLGQGLTQPQQPPAAPMHPGARVAQLTANPTGNQQRVAKPALKVGGPAFDSTRTPRVTVPEMPAVSPTALGVNPNLRQRLQALQGATGLNIPQVSAQPEQVQAPALVSQPAMRQPLPAQVRAGNPDLITGLLQGVPRSLAPTAPQVPAGMAGVRSDLRERLAAVNGPRLPLAGLLGPTGPARTPAQAPQVQEWDDEDAFLGEFQGFLKARGLADEEIAELGPLAVQFAAQMSASPPAGPDAAAMVARPGLGAQSVTSQPPTQQPPGEEVPEPPVETRARTERERREEREQQDQENYEFWRDNPNSPHGGGRRLRRRLAQLNADLVRAGYPALMDSLEWLTEQANTDRMSPEERSRFLAPALETLDDAYTRGEGELNRSLAARGLDNSSYAGAMQAALAGQRAEGRAAAVRQLGQVEEERQQRAQALLRDFVASLMERGTQQAASISGQLFDERMKQQMLDAQSGIDIGSVLSGLGSMAGAASGLGWQPFARRG